MDTKKNERSPEAMLCLLRDGEGKPMHIRVIGNDPTEYRDLCRDYAAFALLKQTQTALNSTVEKYGFIKSSDVPNTYSEDYGYTSYIVQHEKNNKNLISDSGSEPLKGYIDDFLCKTPKDDLIFSSQVVDRGVNNAEILQKLSLKYISVVWEALYKNGYVEGQLVETPRGNWLFRPGDDRNEMGKFLSQLDKYFFDPRLNFDHYNHSAVYFRESHLPVEFDKFNPPLMPGNNIFQRYNIDANDYFIREYTHVIDISPTPEIYWQKFVERDIDNTDPSMSSDIAALLFFERDGAAPNRCVELFLSGDYSRKHRELRQLLFKRHETTEGGDYLKHSPEYKHKLSEMATRIITEDGFNIRGREQTPHLDKTDRADQTDDFFYPRTSKGIHI